MKLENSFKTIDQEKCQSINLKGAILGTMETLVYVGLRHGHKGVTPPRREPTGNYLCGTFVLSVRQGETTAMKTHIANYRSQARQGRAAQGWVG